MQQDRNPLASTLICRLAPLALVAACAGGPPVAPPVHPLDGPTLSLQTNWHSRVVVDRDDSIILTLPSGDRQLQRFHRRAVFSLAIANDGTVSLQLDSLAPVAADEHTPVQATWTGRADDPRVNGLRVSGGGDAADEMTMIVRSLLPRFPAGGAHAETSWTDSAAGRVRVDIFNVDERRQATWTAGQIRRDASGTSSSIPVRVREDYEQMGTGSQGGHRITMTSQGSRSGTYYASADGRLTSASLVDSATMLMSLPDTKQVVPTVRYGRSIVRFTPM